MICLEIGKNIKILKFTETSITLGWLYNSCFNPVEFLAHVVVERKLARIQVEFDSSIYLKHIKGEKNIISEMLSLDFHLTNYQLNSILKKNFPEKIPLVLKIVPIPKEIISWFYYLRVCMSESKFSPQVYI